MFHAAIHMTYKLARRIVVAVVGVTVLLIGIAMIVLPGPAFLVIPVGLAILGAEFAWARHWLHALKDKAQGALNGLNKLRYKSKPGAAERKVDL
jgi:tellurite resistance protein TerC